MAIPLLNPYGDLFELLKFPEDLRLRKKLVWAYSWAVPSSEAVMEIASYGPLIEIGAGSGYWAWLISQTGANVLAMDRNVVSPPHWYKVEEGGPESLSAQPARTLFLCWPTLEENVASACLDHYTGEYILYVGERGVGARTADAVFHERIAAQFDCVREVNLPVWPGFSDSLSVFRRK